MFKEFRNKLNQSTNKGWMLTISAISLTFVFFVVVVISYIISYNINIKSAKMFEDVYAILQEFDDLNDISRYEMKDQIIKEIDDVLVSYPKTTSGVRALFYKGYVNYYAGEYDEAEDIFEYFVKKYKGSHLLSKAYYFLSYCKYKKGNKLEAIDILKTFIDKNGDSYYVPLSCYRVAFIYEETGDVENALTYYNKILNNYRNSSQYIAAKKRAILLKNDVNL